VASLASSSRINLVPHPFRYQGQKIKGQYAEPDGKSHNIHLADGRWIKIKASEWQALWDAENAKPWYRQQSGWIAMGVLLLGAIVFVVLLLSGGGGCAQSVDPCP
jgi:hypothetical protein